MFEELDKVILRHDIKEHDLKEGDKGTIVHVYGRGEGYEVEFFNAKGETIAVLTLFPRDLRFYRNKDEYVSRWFNPTISLGTISGMTLTVSEENVWRRGVGVAISNYELRIGTETPKSKADREEFRYPITAL